jgi:hypothetical protein
MPMSKPQWRPDRAKKFSEMLMDTFRFKMADETDVQVLRSVMAAWAKKLKAGQYPSTLMAEQITPSNNKLLDLTQKAN